MGKHRQILAIVRKFRPVVLLHGARTGMPPVPARQKGRGEMGWPGFSGRDLFVAIR